MTVAEMRTQQMLEDEMAAEWERLNADDPNADKYYRASFNLDEACKKMTEALNCMADAVKDAEGTPGEDRLASLMNDLDNLQTEVLILKNKMRLGVSE